MTALTDLTDQINKAFNNGDVDALAECYAGTATQDHPFFPGGNSGRAAIHAAESGMFASFSDIDWQLQRTIEQGDWGVIEFVVSATNTSDLPTPGGVVPATNKRITIAIANVVRLDDDGLIAEEHRYFDVAGMMGQLGLMG
jgi:hypothetical protein